jgi:YidC/Oxa1 family membrane protein insertase
MKDQQPDNSQNLMIAILLSMAVLFGWQYFFAAPKVREEQARIEREKKDLPSQAGQQAAAPQAGAPVGGQIKSAAPVATAATRAAALKLSPRLAIDTPSLKGSISLKGGMIDDLSLAKYHETIDPKSPLIDLLSPAEAPEPYFVEYGWLPQAPNTPVPGADTVWKPAKDGATLTPESPVALTWDNGQGLVFRRTISVDDRYLFTVNDEVENKSKAEVSLAPYGRIYRIGTPQTQGFYILHEGLIGVAGEDGLQEFTYADATKNSLNQIFPKATGGWMGITDKYWAAALVPGQKEPFRATFAARKAKNPGDKDVYYTDYILPALAVAAGATRGATSNLYAGAKQVSVIEDYQQKLGIKRFDRMIDWGWFYFITKPLFYLMEAINKIVKNFGVTILLLTLIVKGALFPFANWSYESMAKMKKVQPQMEEIKKKFANDKERQQKEMMALYGKEKINPAAGCLPILLQIPIFFALYKVLFVTIDMRHAPFFGWIKDLSAPDPTHLFNLFGLIPWTPPEFMHLGAWVVIMGITMWVQMQLNPPQPDPVQQQVFAWMPVIFTFMLASFPAGLVIYWAWNNVLSIGQQAYIMKKQGTEIPIKDNFVRMFKPLTGLFKSKKA